MSTRGPVVVEIAGRVREGRVVDADWSPTFEDPEPDVKVAVGGGEFWMPASAVLRGACRR